MKSQELSVLSSYGCATLVMMRNIERNSRKLYTFEDRMQKYKIGVLTEKLP